MTRQETLLSPTAKFSLFYYVGMVLDIPWEGQFLQLKYENHTWELPVLCYHRIRVNYPYPFWGVNFMVIFCMVLLHKIIIKHFNRYPFFVIRVNYPIISLNDHIICFQKNAQNYFFPKKKTGHFIKNCGYFDFVKFSH